jgi:4-hydroxythreonine-4-phosphate dehydrogenase
MPKPRVALAIGDPAGIGPEVVLKTLAANAGGLVEHAIVVGDAEPLARHAKACGIAVEIGCDELRWPDGRCTRLVPCGAVTHSEWKFGQPSAGGGRACLAYATRAIAMARAGEVSAVLAAPHTETGVSLAKPGFNGYPSLVAELTETPPERVFLMLLCPEFRVLQVTLHLPLRAAIDRLSTSLVETAVEVGHATLLRFGIVRPKIAVCGLNPHAGENGLIGMEDQEIIAPTVARCRGRGIDASGPMAADAAFAARALYLAMYHDQGHIPVKVLYPFRSCAITVGIPVVFETVAHGSAYDIAGQNLADHNAFANALDVTLSQFVADSARPRQGDGARSLRPPR